MVEETSRGGCRRPLTLMDDAELVTTYQARKIELADALGGILNYLNGFDKPEDFTGPYVEGLKSLRQEAAVTLMEPWMR